jgi:hypothetical protein
MVDDRGAASVAILAAKAASILDYVRQKDNF